MGDDIAGAQPRKVVAVALANKMARIDWADVERRSLSRGSAPRGGLIAARHAGVQRLSMPFNGLVRFPHLFVSTTVGRAAIAEPTIPDFGCRSFRQLGLVLHFRHKGQGLAKRVVMTVFLLDLSLKLPHRQLVEEVNMPA
jgi:hypothetical protein